MKKLAALIFLALAGAGAAYAITSTPSTRTFTYVIPAQTHVQTVTVPTVTMRITVTATTPTTAPTTTATPPPSSGCYLNTVACGYPGPGINDGVPPGTILTPSGGMTITTPGTVIDSLDITGKVQINANNVIIEHSRITMPGVAGATGVQAIGVATGVTGVQVVDSECRNSGGVAIEACIGTGQSAGFSLTRDYFHGCADCIETQGVGTITDSYVTTDLMQLGNHVEDIYVTGTGSRVDVHHSVLLNQQVQTAVVFVDNYLGAGSPASVSDSLVAGGGWTFYASVNLLNVRMARCLSTSIPAPNGGSACTLGADQNGFWPNGGYFGPNPNCAAKNATWTNVVWDDNGLPVGC